MSESQDVSKQQPASHHETGTQGGSGQPPQGPVAGTDDSKRGRWIAIGWVVVLLALILWAVSQPPPQPAGLNCGALVQTGTAEAQAQGAAAAEAAVFSYLADEHVILTGFQSALDQVTAELAKQGIQLEAVRDCNLGAFEPSPELGLAPRPAAPWQADPLKINLYRIVGDQTVTEVITAVEAIADPSTGRPVAHADPNYRTVGTAGPCSSPDHIGGSPDHIGGSPDHIGGSPFELPVGPDVADPEKLFREQWALEHIGLGSTRVYATGIASIAYTGKGVRVGVFDTSPFGVQTETAEPQAGRGSRLEMIDWVSPHLALTVEDDSAYRLNRAPLSAAEDDPDAMKQHGLFVAGLIHALAPGSDIHLYRVLDDSGCGDVYSLVAALNRFTAQVNTDRRVMRLRGAVANLSLGVLKPTSQSDTSGAFVPTPELCEQLGLPAEPCRALLDMLVRDRIEALQVTVEWAHDNDIVVVAAAGNGSGRDGRPVRPPDLPAAYPTVLGVAGSNVNRLRACFSNWGDLFAPSGDGVAETGDKPHLCGTSLGECDGKGNCNNAIVSLVQKNIPPPPDQPQDAPSRFKDGYAYWKGTSFSAPMVSGLAALAAEVGTRKAGHVSRWLAPHEVARAIDCGSSLGDGIINVPATLALCVRP